MSQIVDAEAGQFRTFADDGPMRLEVLERPAIDSPGNRNSLWSLRDFFIRSSNFTASELSGTNSSRFCSFSCRADVAGGGAREVDVCPLRLERLALA